MEMYIKTEDAIPYLTRYIPSVDAVERSKIDKAIEEIKNITPRATIRHGKTNTDSTLMIPLDKVLEIIKRNIGE